MSDLTRGAHPDPELLTALADGELEPTALDAVLSHVASCADCRPVLDAERRLKAAVRALRDDEAGSAVGTASDPASDLALSPDLLARLRAVASSSDPVPIESAPTAGESPAVASLAERRAGRAVRAGRAPAYLGAAASVVVFMVGAFAFLGATGSSPAPSGSSSEVAIVPAADRMTLEHAATNAQTSLGGPGVMAVSASVPVASASADAR